MSLQNDIIKFVMMYGRRVVEKDEDIDLKNLRRSLDELFTRTFITPWTVSVSPITLKGIEAEIITPNELKREDCIILFAHGGGFFMGSINTHRSLAAWVVHETGIPAVIFNYRLAPEHPFPAGRDDLIKVYGELMKEYPHERIAFVGDSAGGGIIVQALLAMQELNMKMPACAALMSPFLDLTCSSRSIKENEDKDTFVVPKIIKSIIPHYIQEPYKPDSSIVNPLYADISGFPPTIIHVGSIETLRDDSRNLAARLEAFDVECEFWEYEGLPHVWQFNRQFFLPEAQKALSEAKDFIYKYIPEITY